MNKELKIAIYSGSIPSTTFIENLIKGITPRHKVLLFGKQNTKSYTGTNIFCYPIYANKFKNLTVSKWRTFLLLLKYPKRFILGMKEIRSKKGLFAKYNWWIRYAPVLLHLPDVFHIQWAKDLSHWIFLKEALGVKIVLSLRGAHINYSPISNKELAGSYRMNFPKVDAFHAVSEAIGIEAQKYEAPAPKIKVIHSLIGQDTFKLFQIPQERKCDILNIISVGRHHWKKGYATALDACRLLKNEGVLFEYTVVAGGKMPEELIVQRHQLDLINEIQFVSSLSQDEVFLRMQGSDVLLLPSYEEGIANVVLEAMAIGVPVISADCGGMSEVVIPDETGWLVSILDAKEMADALIEFNTTENEKKRHIVKNAYTLVSEEFNFENKRKEFFEFYDIIMNN